MSFWFQKQAFSITTFFLPKNKQKALFKIQISRFWPISRRINEIRSEHWTWNWKESWKLNNLSFCDWGIKRSRDMKDKVTHFDCQPGPSVASAWVFFGGFHQHEVVIWMRCTFKSSFPSLLLVSILCVQESSTCCQLGSSAFYHGVPADLLSLVSGSAEAYGFLAS